jgi:hypothetical protein
MKRQVIEEFIAKSTLPMQHGIVRRIALTLYCTATNDDDMVPKPRISFVKEMNYQSSRRRWHD